MGDSDFIKEREGDILGDGGFQILKMGDSLKEGRPFLLGDGKFSDFENGGFP